MRERVDHKETGDNMKLQTFIGSMVLAFSVAVPAHADDSFPSQPIRVVVPFQPGSSPDATMRFLGQQLTEVLKQPIVIDNRPGAGGLMGGDVVAKAPPDGYTLGYLSNQHLLHPYMVAKMPYDPLKAFTPVSMLGRSAQVMLVPASHPATDLRSFLAAAKAKTGTLKFGSGGIGSPAHLAGQVFAKQAGIQAVHVPYKGAPESVTALMGGHLDYVIATAGVAAPVVKSGKARALAVTSDTRHTVFPDVPTLAESFPQGLVLEPWSVIAAPANTPVAVVDKLNKAFAQVLRDPRTVDYYKKLGGEILVLTPNETATYYRDEAKRLSEWVGDVGLQRN
jgi:tripartite-type tricarboxylate transporter receptor subunit TctC